MMTTETKPISFDTLQLQSEIGAVIDFFFLLRKNLRGMLAITLYLLFKLEWYQYYWIALGLLLLVAVLSVSAYLSYKHTSFKIDKENSEFILNKGIINKSKVSIQLDKINQVNINQNFLQRMLKVYSLEIETAGSVKSEAIIKALDQSVAFELKKALLNESAIANEAAITPSHDTFIEQEIISKNSIKISPLQLVKYAFTTDYIRSSLILIGIVLSFYTRIQEYLQTFHIYEEDLENAAVSLFEAQSIFVLIAILFAVAIMINAVRNIITYFQMEIKLNNDTTWITYGLFARKNTVLHNDRTQIFTINSNPVQRWLNTFKLDITQISSNIESDKKAKITVAGANKNQVEQLFEHIFHAAMPASNVYLKPSIRVVFLPAVVLGLLPSVAVGMLAYLHIFPLFSMWIMAGYLLLLSLLLIRYFRNYELHIADGFIIKKQKIWKDKTQIIRIEDLQSIYTDQYIWQVHNKLGNIVLQTAGGNLIFRYGDFDDIELLTNYLVYKVEMQGNG